MRGPKMARADADVRAAEADAMATRQRLALEASRAFYRVALGQFTVATSRDLAAWLDSVATYNRSRVKEGVTSEADLIRSELERDRAAADASIAEAELAAARGELGGFLGAPGRSGRLEVAAEFGMSAYGVTQGSGDVGHDGPPPAPGQLAHLARDSVGNFARLALGIEQGLGLSQGRHGLRLRRGEEWCARAECSARDGADCGSRRVHDGSPRFVAFKLLAIASLILRLTEQSPESRTAVMGHPPWFAVVQSVSLHGLTQGTFRYG